MWKTVYAHRTGVGGLRPAAQGVSRCELSWLPPVLSCLPALRPQEQMEDMRKKEEHLEKEMQEVSAQNRRLAEPLQKAREEMNEMRRKLGDHKRDKQILVVGGAFVPLAPRLRREDAWALPPDARTGRGP